MRPERITLSYRLSVGAACAARAAFAATIVLLPLRARYVLQTRPVDQVYMDFTDFLLYASDITMLLLLTSWCLSWLFAMRPIRFGPRIVWLPLLGLTLAGLFSVASSLDSHLSLYHLLRHVILLYFYLYVVNEIRTPGLVTVCAAILLVSESVFAILQFAAQRSIGLQSFGEHNLDPAVSGVSVVSDGITRLLRAYALTEHPNILGGCLTFSLLLLLAAYLYGNKRARPGIALAFIMGMLALFFTFSRSAWLALFIGLGFIAGVELFTRRRENLQDIMVLSLAATLLLFPSMWTFREFIGARLNVADSFERIPLEARSINERAFLNRAAVEIFLDRPLRGVGLGTAALAIGAYYPGFPGYYAPPHFALLTVAMETGVLGAVSYLGLLLFPLILWVQHGRRFMNSPRVIVASALLWAVTLVGLFDIYPWLPPSGQLWQWLVWGLLGAADHEIS